MSEIITNVVPALAAQWFGTVLSDAGIPCCFQLENRLIDLNLQVLNGTCGCLVPIICMLTNFPYNCIVFTNDKSYADLQ